MPGLSLFPIGDDPDDIRRALQDIRFNFERLQSNWPQVAGRVVSGGKTNIATSQSTTSTSYTTLTTPDLVTVVLPTDGLIAVWYQALWQNTVAANARAAIFIGANQMKTPNGGGAPGVADATGPAELNDDGVLSSAAHAGLSASGGVGAATEVTTGSLIQNGAGTGFGPAYIFAAAGTYDVSIKFKNNAAGTLTAKNRHLWVSALAFS